MNEANNPRQVPILVGRECQQVPAVRQGQVVNSANGQVIAQVPLCGMAQVNEAVSAAKTAFASWSEVPAVERVRFLFKYRLAGFDANA